jgi:hypothetical protein
MRGDYARSIATNVEDPNFINALAYDLWGRRDEGIALLLEIEGRPVPRVYRSYAESIRLILEDRTEDARRLLETMRQTNTVRDPCAIFYVARELARVGANDEAMAMLKRSVEGGFTCFEFMTRDPWLESLRARDEFRALLRTAEARERQARAAFIEAGGERVLNVRG